MTRVDKSPEQLDAEAAAPLEERDLDLAVLAHRRLFRVECGILRLHQRDGESGLGPPFSQLFENYLDGRLGAFPWSRALFHLRYVCRGNHPEHLREEWRGALCWALVNLVVRQDYSLGGARKELYLANEGKSRRTLDSALLTIERRLEDQLAAERQRQTPVQRSPSEWMAPAHVHHRLEGLHAEECEQCRRAA